MESDIPATRTHGISPAPCNLARLEPPPQHRAWVNPKAARYYQVHLDRDLFGDWTLLKVWGDIGPNRRQMHSTGVASYESGVDLVDEIARRRSKRGYAAMR